MSAITCLLSLVQLSLMWASTQAQGSLPTASIQPTSVIVAPGQSTTFTCTTSGANSAPMWQHNNLPVTNNENNNIDDAQSQLTVMNFSSDLAGNYTCVASNDVGSVSSSTALLQSAVHDADFLSSDMSSPHQVTVQAGQPMPIQCGTVTNLPASDLNWRVRFGSVFESISLFNDRATVGLDQNLYLLEPMMTDNGMVFNCRSTNTDLNEIDNGYIQINVEASSSPPAAPMILVPPQDVATRSGETVSFECIPGGMDVTSRAVQWQPPSGVNNFRLSSDRFRLSIASVNQANVGTYSCTVSGIEGTFSASLTLIDPPVLDSALPSEPVSLVYGQALSLSCASPSATYWEWFQNATKLTDVTDSSLQVASVALEHAGAYQCIAYNSAGFAESATQVEVMIIEASITDSPPPIQVIFRSQPFSMSCSAEGAPPPTYSWSKGQTPLQTGTSFELGPEGSLLIRDVDPSSEGEYTCTASNALPGGQTVGTDSSVTMIRPIAPTIITTNIGPLFSIQVDTGAILPCQASSEDPTSVISYSWTKDGQPLNTDGRVQFVNLGSSGNVSFMRVMYTDAGMYQCTVRTMHGELPAPTLYSMNISVVVTDTPVAPHILSLNSSSPNSFHIEFLFSGMPTFVSNYTIEIQGPPYELWQRVETRSSNALTAADINSNILQAFTLYNVRVVATYTSGMRVPSEPVMVRTGADVPKDSPVDVRAHAPNNMALSITWKPPTEPRGDIIDYIIKYSIKDDITVITIRVGGNQTLHVIDGLKEFTRFTIQVAAVTSAGPGPFSKAIEGITNEGGLEEPQSDSFVSTIGFIVLIVALGLFLVVVVVVGLLVLRHRWNKIRSKTTGRYEVRHSGYFGKVVIGSAEAPDGTDLSESAVASYTGRGKRAFNSTSPTGSDALDAPFEGESSFGGTEYTLTTGTPQLSTASSARLMGAHAPSYIDPPPFEEALRNTRSRSQSASSAHHGNKEWPTENWINEEGHMEYPNHGEYMEENSDDSVDKDPMDTSSDLSDQQSDHTQYSHLAGANVIHHHQISVPTSAGSSSGGAAPPSFSEMVDSRLRQQSPEAQPINYDTYV